MEARELTKVERSLLEFLLTRRFAGRDALVQQAETVRTRGSSCRCGCPSFSLVPDRSLAAADVTERMVSDAHGLDPGGKAVAVLLFAQGGYLSEIEVFGYEDGAFASLPDPSALTLNEWSEPTRRGGIYLANP
jgi:hypothetical protein